MTDEKNQLEASETDALVDKGVVFTVGKRKFKISQPKLGTLDLISKYSLQMQFEADENIDPAAAAVEIVRKSARVWAKVAAIAVLNSKWKIRLLSRPLARFFYWNLTPSVLRKLAMVLVKMNNTTDFIISIRLIAGIRTARPNLIEESKRA